MIEKYPQLLTSSLYPTNPAQGFNSKPELHPAHGFNSKPELHPAHGFNSKPKLHPAHGFNSKPDLHLAQGFNSKPELPTPQIIEVGYQGFVPPNSSSPMPGSLIRNPKSPLKPIPIRPNPMEVFYFTFVKKYLKVKLI